MEQLNIVELIENNPVTKINNNYNVKLLSKINTNFNGFEQQMFLSGFYCYINNDRLKDYVVDLDKVWKWLGFSSKFNSVRVLEKHFKVVIDYKENMLVQIAKQENEHGGHNIIKYMLNIKCFKSLCLKAQTKKASQIHEYYINLEEIIQEVIDEESNELRLQLDDKNKQITEQNKQLENVTLDKDNLRENTILDQFPDDVQCIYYGLTDNVSSDDEPLIKFGCSNFLSDRVRKHKKTYKNFRLVSAFRVQNKTQIETALKNNTFLSSIRRQLQLKRKHTELLLRSEIDKIDETIREIIEEIEFTPEKYTVLLEELEEIKNENLKDNNSHKERYNLLLQEKLKEDNSHKERYNLLLQEKLKEDNSHKERYNLLLQENLTIKLENSEIKYNRLLMVVDELKIENEKIKNEPEIETDNKKTKIQQKYINNKEKVLLKSHNYYSDNREKILSGLKNKPVINCPCGSTYKCSPLRHVETKIHQKYILSQK
jgi:hypothetical protein